MKIPLFCCCGVWGWWCWVCTDVEIVSFIHLMKYVNSFTIYTRISTLGFVIDKLLYPSTTHIIIINKPTDNISSTNIHIWQHSSQSVTSCPSVCHPLSAACYTWPLAGRRSRPLQPPGTAVSSGWGPGGTPPHSDLASWLLALPLLPLLHAVKIKRRFKISMLW